MTGEPLQIVLYLLAAVMMGGAIGIERTFHGHAAGFRTHTLVCLTSCALMLLAVYPSTWFAVVNPDVPLNITRVIQGVMTGIGFLGAGVIMKQGLEVRGLTTAAGIWSAAAIGILVGLGSMWTALCTTALTLIVLTVFRTAESKVPIELIVHAEVRFARDTVLAEDALRALVSRFGFSVDELTYALDVDQLFVYRLVMKTRSQSSLGQLAGAFGAEASVRQFDIALRRD
jgi:putative Mg2+ transporter-C (MgtC) family protein